jgi:hypothetical protein
MQNDQERSSKLSTQSFIDRLQKSTAMEIDTEIQTTENTTLPPLQQPEVQLQEQQEQQQQQQQQEINDNTSEKTVEDEQNSNQQFDNTNSEEQQQQQQQNNNIKSDPTFNWLQHFPISSEMELNDKLQTPLSFQIFEFLKSNLYSFYSRKIIKPETPTRRPLKANFNQLIRSMADAKP